MKKLFNILIASCIIIPSISYAGIGVEGQISQGSWDGNIHVDNINITDPIENKPGLVKQESWNNSDQMYSVANKDAINCNSSNSNAQTVHYYAYYTDVGNTEKIGDDTYVILNDNLEVSINLGIPQGGGLQSVSVPFDNRSNTLTQKCSDIKNNIDKFSAGLQGTIKFRLRKPYAGDYNINIPIVKLYAVWGSNTKPDLGFPLATIRLNANLADHGTCTLSSGDTNIQIPKVSQQALENTQNNAIIDPTVYTFFIVSYDCEVDSTVTLIEYNVTGTADENGNLVTSNKDLALLLKDETSSESTPITIGQLVNHSLFLNKPGSTFKISFTPVRSNKHSALVKGGPYTATGIINALIP